MNTLNLIRNSFPLFIGALCFMGCSDELASSDSLETLVSTKNGRVKN